MRRRIRQEKQGIDNMINNERMIAFIDSFDKGNTPLLYAIEQEAKKTACL